MEVIEWITRQAWSNGQVPTLPCCTHLCQTSMMCSEYRAAATLSRCALVCDSCPLSGHNFMVFGTLTRVVISHAQTPGRVPLSSCVCSDLSRSLHIEALSLSSGV